MITSHISYIGGSNMNKYSVKAAACALVGTLSLSSYQTTLEAKIHNSSDVPAAGVAVVLDEGSTIQDLQVEVVQNIAYLESASGLQPNIIKAAQRVAVTDMPEDVVLSDTNTKTTAAKVATEFTQEISDAISEAGLDFLTETSTEGAVREETQQETTLELSTELMTEWEIPERESSEEKDSDEEASSEEGSEEEETVTEEGSEEESLTEETSTEEDSTEGTDSEDNDFQTSAGFSATDTYDDVEIEEKAETKTETKEDEQDFSGLVIAQVTNYVNVRSTPGEEGEIVGKLYANSVGELVEEENGWYKIVSGNCTGYVKGEFCVAGEEAKKLAKEVGTTYAIVNTTTLKVRQDATTDSAVLGLVPLNEELVVLEELDGWVKIAIEEGDGYVSKDYINLRTDFVHAESKEEEAIRLAKEAKAREEARAAAAATEVARLQRQAETQAQRSAANQATIESARNIAASSEGSEMGKAVIDYATQFVGNPYVYGGSSLTNGTDCSGFVMSVYNNFGVSLPHSSSALRSQGYDVGGLENAQPGDIVCYSGHVGLYVGNGQIVHASTSKTGIIVSSASYRSVLSVRRIF